MEIINLIDTLPNRGEYTQRLLKQITTLVIHHSDSPAGKFNSVDFANWHITGKYKMPRIAYHFTIDVDGTVNQTNQMTSRSWHASDANIYSIGILLNGDFTTEEPTLEQMQSLRELIPFIEHLLNKVLTVKGHCEVDATSCPGKNLMKLKSEWRTLK